MGQNVHNNYPMGLIFWKCCRVALTKLKIFYGDIKGTVFFFSRKSSWAIHSFKKPKVLFFLSTCFFFQEKFISHSFKIWRGLTAFLTNWTVFFCLIFLLFLFFLEKFTMSFIHLISKLFFFFGPRKKTGFSFNQSILPKKVNKMNFAGEKKYGTFGPTHT